VSDTGTPDVQSVIASLRRRVMTVVFMIDVSGSVKGERLAAVNSAIKNAVSALKKYDEGSATVEIQVAIMEFASSAVWRTPVPEPVSEYRYDEITRTGGGTNYSNAFKSLDEKLSSGAFAFMGAEARSYSPALILLTDGRPSDPLIYGEALDRLKKTACFRRTVKAGVAIGEGASSNECLRALAEFTGDKGTVFSTGDIRTLDGLIERTVLNGVDLSARRPLEVVAPSNDVPPPMPLEWEDPEIPGFEDIDWERDFPPFNPAGSEMEAMV
jgi:uncharacterized protein YegL